MIRDVQNVKLPLFCQHVIKWQPLASAVQALLSEWDIMEKEVFAGMGNSDEGLAIEGPSVFWMGDHPNTDRWDGQMGTCDNQQ